MKITVTKSNTEFGQRFFSDYQQKPGAQHIASQFAIAHLSAVLDKLKPTTVIEYGAGIGTMTHALLEHASNVEKVISTEANGFCLEQLAKNIPERLTERLTIVKEKGDLDALIQKSDLVIFDGGSVGAQEVSFLDKGSVCFVEGARFKTVEAINKELKKVGLICNFENYNQGYRYFFFYKKINAKTGRKKFKFKFRQQIKGFQVGEVIAA